MHVFSGDGRWVSFTYQDHPLAQFAEETPEHECDLRNIGVSAPFGPVTVNKTHPRNRDGEFFSACHADHPSPWPGSDDIQRACEEGWVGTGGYLRPDGSRQRRARLPRAGRNLPSPLAGTTKWSGPGVRAEARVVTHVGQVITEVFLVDLPDDITIAGDGPLEGTATHRPRPPRGHVQRRLTFTAGRRHPGLQGPRHWLRSSPDGAKIAFLMRTTPAWCSCGASRRTAASRSR